MKKEPVKKEPEPLSPFNDVVFSDLECIDEKDDNNEDS